MSNFTHFKCNLMHRMEINGVTVTNDSNSSKHHVLTTTPLGSELLASSLTMDAMVTGSEEDIGMAVLCVPILVYTYRHVLHACTNLYTYIYIHIYIKICTYLLYIKRVLFTLTKIRNFHLKA